MQSMLVTFKFNDNSIKIFCTIRSSCKYITINKASAAQNRLSHFAEIIMSFTSLQMTN